MWRLIAPFLAAAVWLSAWAPAEALTQGQRIAILGPPANCDAAGTLLTNAMAPAPNRARKRLICATVSSLEATGVWAKLDALWVTAAASQQAANLNWTNPASFTLSQVNGPTFTPDRGYAGDGVTSYVNTGFAPSTNGVHYTLNAASLMVWSLTSGTNGSLFGWSDGSNDAIINPYDSGTTTTRVRVNDNVTIAPANTGGRGMFLANRSGSAAVQIYKNTAQLGTSTQASTGLVAVPLNIGRVTASTFSAAQAAAAAVGGSLSSTDETNLYNALNVYMTAIGAAP